MQGSNMKKHRKMATAGALALVVALTACGKQALAPQSIAPASVPAVAGAQLPPSTATVLGELRDAGWYMVVTAQGTAKPLVIQADSKPACESSVAEFSIKAVDPGSKNEPPKAWCMIGSEIRAKLRV
jgi:hypothetical protein